MCAVNRGKSFEDNVKDSILKLGDVYIQRLYDPQGGQLGVSNPADFIAYKKPQFYLLECKSTHANTLSIYTAPNPKKKKYGAFSNTQWEGMLEASKFGAVAGGLVWWIDHDVTKFIPIQELEKIRNTGAKSIRYDLEIPNSLIIKGRKKIVNFDYDFTEFFNKYENRC